MASAARAWTRGLHSWTAGAGAHRSQNFQRGCSLGGWSSSAISRTTSDVASHFRGAEVLTWSSSTTIPDGQASCRHDAGVLERPIQSRVALVAGVLGLGIWAWGLTMFVGGDQGIGGAIMLGGGALIVIALQGGWGEFWEGLANWLYFR